MSRPLASVGAVLKVGPPLPMERAWRARGRMRRQRAADNRAREERSRLVNKILSVAERQRSGMAAELHDGPIQALTRLGLMLERGRLRLRRGQVEDGLALLTDAQTAGINRTSPPSCPSGSPRTRRSSSTGSPRRR